MVTRYEQYKWSDFNRNYDSEHEFELYVNRVLEDYLRGVLS